MYYLPKFGYVEYIVATCGVESLMKENTDFKDFVQKSLSRFHRCDWGEMDEEDIQANNNALVDESRILGAYEEGVLPKIWIIAEAVSDTGVREAITVLFPSEY